MSGVGQLTPQRGRTPGGWARGTGGRGRVAKAGAGNVGMQAHAAGAAGRSVRAGVEPSAAIGEQNNQKARMPLLGEAFF